MTRVFLAAGVAALAIAAPAAAGPHGGGGHNGGGRGNGGGAPAFVNNGGGGQRAQANGGGGRHGGGGGGFRMQSFSGGGGGGHGHGGGGFRMQAYGGGHGNGGFAMRAQHQQRQQARADFSRGQQRMAFRQQAHGNGHAQAQQRMAFQKQAHGHAKAQNRMAFRQQGHGNNHAQAQSRMAFRQQAHGNGRAEAMNRQQLRTQQQAQRMHGNGMNQNRFAAQQQMRFDRQAANQQLRGERQMRAQNLLAEREALRADRIANVGAFQQSRFATLVETPRKRFIEPAQAVRFVGQPLGSVTNYVTLAALPSSVSYLYPDTSDYYYRYGDGYLYQVDRGDNLIASLIPLLAGGYLPGTYLPQPYMASYVPDYYGLSSFYPASYAYGGYGYDGYDYGNLCNRYANGVIYQVNCYTGMVENVIPMYAGGYGVGQMIPSAYSYYNVPMQYRDLYYPTAEYSYWYAPGAIYQYDTDTSLITSVAALMSPGFSIGQPLPAGYDVYNVPYAYRATYYDTPNAWYRYNNGYIYQVDPTTQLVTAIVASLLT